jgi:chromosome partitioning protein
LQYGLPVAPIRLGDRVDYNRCLIAGQTAQEYEPDGKAAEELMELYKWASKLVGMSARKEKAA